MQSAARKSIFERPFSSRTGRKAYLFVLPFVLIMLFIPTADIIGTILFAGLLTSRLNDTGWSRWHAAWLTLWMLVIVTVASVHPAHGVSMAQHKAALGLIELPLFALLLGLGAFPGQKTSNRFGPAPLGLREFLAIRRNARAYRKAYAKIGPEINQLVTRQKDLVKRVQDLRQQMRDHRVAGNQLAADALKPKFDEAVRASQDATAKLKEVTAQLTPARERLEEGRQRIRDIASYKSAA